MVVDLTVGLATALQMDKKPSERLLLQLLARVLSPPKTE